MLEKKNPAAVRRQRQQIETTHDVLSNWKYSGVCRWVSPSNRDNVSYCGIVSCDKLVTHFTKYQNSLLPERESRALSAVCRRVSPSCHSLCGSSHSFLSPTWCSARRSSESAMQRSKDVKSFSASAEGETEHQHLHNDKGASVFWEKFAYIFEMSQELKCKLGSVGVKRLSECQENIKLLFWTL